MYHIGNANGKDENGELYFDQPTMKEQTWMDVSDQTWLETKLKFRKHEMSNYEYHMLNKKVEGQKVNRG